MNKKQTGGKKKGSIEIRDEELKLPYKYFKLYVESGHSYVKNKKNSDLSLRISKTDDLSFNFKQEVYKNFREAILNPDIEKKYNQRPFKNEVLCTHTFIKKLIRQINSTLDKEQKLKSVDNEMASILYDCVAYDLAKKLSFILISNIKKSTLSDEVFKIYQETRNNICM